MCHRPIRFALQSGVCVLLLCLFLPDFSANAQQPKPVPEPPPKKRLLDTEPFDQLTLPNSDKKPQIVHIQPLDSPPTEGEPVKVYVIFPENDEPARMLHWKDHPDYQYIPYSTLLMKEAEGFMVAEKTGLAYANYLYLKKHYPKTGGLDKSLKTFLYADVRQKYSAGEYALALTAMEELHRRDPGYTPEGFPSQSRMLGILVTKVADDLYEKRRYKAMREFLKRFEREFGREQEVAEKHTELLKAVADGTARLKKDAQTALAHSQKLLDDGDYRQARASSRQVLALWPETTGVETLLSEIYAKYKLVLVGVGEPTVSVNPTSMQDWGGRRSGRLAVRNLLKYTEPGSEGGEYISPLGSIEWNPDTKQLLFSLRKTKNAVDGDALTPYDVSQRLLDLGDPENPEHSPQWARLLDSVETVGDDQVIAHLRFPHVNPRAVLQEPVEPKSEGRYVTQDGPFQIGKVTPKELAYKTNPEYDIESATSMHLVEIHEEDPKLALAALKRGEFDVLDRLFPADAAQLKKSPDLSETITLGRYDLPTMHMLVPNLRTAHMKNRTFRRALLYALNREVILDQLLLRQVPILGCEVRSGPFPYNVPNNPGVGYGYDDRIEPRKWEPRLALTLAALAEGEIAEIAKVRQEPKPERPVFVLAHPATAVANVACTAIAEQLEMIGLTIELKELPHGYYDDPDLDYDLLYLEMMTWEPLVDARRLFSPEGIVKSPGPYINLALRHLDTASNWDQVRRRLNQLHRICYEDLTVIPLWQMMEFYAYHNSLQGITKQRLQLYDDLEKWRVAPITSN